MWLQLLNKVLILQLVLNHLACHGLSNSCTASEECTHRSYRDFLAISVYQQPDVNIIDFLVYFKCLKVYLYPYVLQN